MDAWWQIWWVWLALAGVLGIVEVLVSGFIFLGFSIGAVVMVIASLAGLTIALPPTLLLYALASSAGYLAVRLLVPGSRSDSKIWRDDINDINR